MSEHDLQVAIIKWAHLYQKKWPELKLLHAIPNGGYRNIKEAKRLKDEGVLAGIPDLFLPVPRENYCGLYIELKYNKNKLTKEQKTITDLLKHQGYKTIVCNNVDDTIHNIINYLLSVRT